MAGFALAAASARACNVPVFRYALERWRPDPYEVILFHKGPLTPELEKLVAELRKAGDDAKEPANVEVLTVDLAGEVPEAARKLWEAQAKGAIPWMVVRYPVTAGIEASVWSGTPTPEIVKVLLQSPARREIARRLQKGDSVVWVLLETGDKKQDDATAELVQTELKKLEKSLKLPNPDSPDDDGKVVKLLSELPLQVRFSVLRVSRTDAAEKQFVSMLVNTDDEIAKMKDVPLMFPLFGRGRALDAFAGKGINAENIEAVASFLTGACSCTVKRLSPGADVLMAANWEAILEAGTSAPAESPNKPGVPVPIPSAAPPKTEFVAPTVRVADVVVAGVLGDSAPRANLWPYLSLAGMALLLLAVAIALRFRKANGDAT
jgi:hypothetical protein